MPATITLGLGWLYTTDANDSKKREPPLAAEGDLKAADTIRTILGVGLVLIAAIGTTVYIVVPFLVQGTAASGLSTMAFAVASMCGGLGLSLVRDGVRGRSEGVPRALSMPPAGLWLACTVLGLVLGAVTGRGRRAAYLFPPFHVLAFVGWTGFLISLISSRLPRLTKRDATAELAYGGLVATTVGGGLELILFAIFGIGAFLISAILPAGRFWIAAIESALSEPSSLGDLTGLATLPPVVAVLGLSLVVAAPVVEEGAKGLGALLGSARPVTRDHYLAWGLWSGLGFGLMESLLNAASMGPAWVPAALMRFLTIAMHGLTGALMGLAWHLALREKRAWPAFGVSFLCVAIHGLWNGTALAIGLLALRGMPLIEALP